MLWYKSWLDTRWRFVTGLALLMLGACALVVAYERVMQLMPLVPTADAGGELGRRIREAAELVREYRGYVWSQWFRQTPIELGTLFAVLLGSGGLLSHGTGTAALFTLSLPISRRRLLGIRAAMGLAELFALALLPSLVIVLISPAIGKSYGLVDALVHGFCLFVAGAVFFSLALFLSTIFDDIWRPLLIALSVAAAVGVAEVMLRVASAYGIFGVMTGEVYFRTGGLPWIGLLMAAAASAALLYGAIVNITRRDF